MNNAVANTILQQLGGNRFIAMTGAKNFVGTENALHFQLPNRKINSVVVRLDATDTYTVMFNKRTNMGVNIKQVSSDTMVYADKLRAVFEKHTGLYTSL
jgi:hypothetical protein